MQNKPPYTLEIIDDEKLIYSGNFTFEENRGILARSRWLNVSAIESVKLTVKDAKGHALTVGLAGFLKAQASNDNFTMTVQGSQGFNRRNLAFTVFVSPKKREVAA